LKELSSSPYQESWTRIIAPRLSAPAADRFSFRKESAAPSGLIAWPAGEDLILSAKQSLIAGAKAHLEHARHYGNRLGQFAKRYLETVLMGQTAPGSYIITAYAPADATVPIRGGAHDELSYEGITVASGRRINVSYAHALEAAAEAVEHYHLTGSFAGFDDGVNRGVSYEMARALKGITQNSDGADVTIEWDSLVPEPSMGEKVVFEFKGSDTEVFDKAATRLVAPEAPRQISVIGRVHLLTKKQAGGPGVVGIETFGSSQPKKLRVRMESIEHYTEAVRAHGQDLAVRASGTLAREGTLNWLYDARLVEVLGSIESFMGWDDPDPPVLASGDLELMEIDPGFDDPGNSDHGS
jgi:hypothetical protein